MKANEIVEYLKRFLKTDSPYRCILINGSWGIGKTYEVKKVLSSVNQKMYISLFGMHSLESVYSEMAFQLVGINGLDKYIRAFKFPDLPYGINKVTNLVTPKNILTFLINKEKLVNYTVFFDDLERISSSFPFDEFMGLVESIRLSNIKVVLIANKDELKDNKETFDRYCEKIIDREYNIDHVSEKLMEGQEKYNQDLINEFIINHGITNIRTLEKAQNFFEDVYPQISGISDDNIKEQVRKTCYAIVFEDVDKIYEKKLEEEREAESGKEGYDFSSVIYKEFDTRVKFKYLYNHNFSSDIVTSIINYYFTHRTFNLELLKMQYVEFLNTLKQATYYKSTDEVREIVSEYEREINNFRLSLPQLIIKSNKLIIWKEILHDDCSVALKNIEEKAKEIIDEDLNTSRRLDEQSIDNFDYNIESKILLEVLKKINSYITDKYIQQIFTDIDILAEANQFDDIYNKLRILIDILYIYKDKVAYYTDILLKDIFLLTGNVSEDKVRCWRKIVKIQKMVNPEKLEEFIKQKKEELAADKMFIHRTNESLK